MSESDNWSDELPSAFSLFKPSMNAISVNLVTLIELVLVPLLVVTLGRLIGHGGGAVISFIGEIMALLLAPAAYLTQLQSAKGKTIDFTKAIKDSLHYFWRLVGLGIVLFVIIGVGFLLLIVPGVFLLRRYILSPYYLLDRDMKVFDAMKASATDSKTFSGAIWGLIGVDFLLVIVMLVLTAILGSLEIIGLAIYYTYYCAPAIRYLQIKRAVKPTAPAAPIV
jgi:hypothetical protein